jgi:hypothetical protein
MAQKRKTRKVITQELYDTVKKLDSLGEASLSDMARMLGISTSSVSRIVGSESLEAMHEKNNRHYYARKHAEKQEVEMPKFESTGDEQSNEPVPKENTKSVAPVFDMQEMAMVNIMESLNRVAVAMERMADAWEAQPKKKKGLF